MRLTHGRYLACVHWPDFSVQGQMCLRKTSLLMATDFKVLLDTQVHPSLRVRCATNITCLASFSSLSHISPYSLNPSNAKATFSQSTMMHNF